MNNKILYPFFVIMALAVIITIGLSVKGLGDSKEIASTSNEKGTKGESVAFDGKAFYDQTCAGCHGGKYEGAVGPSLKGIGGRYSAEEIKKIVTKGRGIMPGGLVTSNDADKMVEFLQGL